MIAKKVSLLCPKTLSQSVLVSYFSKSSPPQFQPPVQLQRQEEDSRSVRVSVWWDLENCHFPTGVNLFRVAQTISAAVRVNGMKRPVQITADVYQLSRTKQEVLPFTGLNMIHVSNGGKNIAEKYFPVDLVFWVSENPPPAQFFPSSGDRDFANILYKLRKNRYDIFFASREEAPRTLHSAASIMWCWNELVRGDNKIEKCFYQLDSGLRGSCRYGHYKLPLEDSSFSVLEPSPPPPQPFPKGQTPACYSVRPTPKAVMKQIRQVLSLYPQGIPITALRVELVKSCGVMIDKDFYGHRKFSRFLSAMPQVVRLENKGDGLILARAVLDRAHEPSDEALGWSSTDILDSIDPLPSSKMDIDSASEKNLTPFVVKIKV